MPSLDHVVPKAPDLTRFKQRLAEKAAAAEAKGGDASNHHGAAPPAAGDFGAPSDPRVLKQDLDGLLTRLNSLLYI